MYITKTNSPKSPWVKTTRFISCFCFRLSKGSTPLISAMQDLARGASAMLDLAVTVRRELWCLHQPGRWKIKTLYTAPITSTLRQTHVTTRPSSPSLSPRCELPFSPLKPPQHCLCCSQSPRSLPSCLPSSPFFSLLFQSGVSAPVLTLSLTTVQGDGG